MTERRTKEIGIRRVLGASASRVTWTMIREFLVLVTIANVIALILVQFGWSKVLQTGLLYVSGIGPGAFVFAALISLLAASAAVLSQTLKASRRNPAESLRSE